MERRDKKLKSSRKKITLLIAFSALLVFSMMLLNSNHQVIQPSNDDNSLAKLEEYDLSETSQVVFVSAGAGDADGLTTTVIYPSIPSSTLIGDLFLCHVVILDLSINMVSIDGFTLLSGPHSSDEGRIWIYSKYATVDGGSGTVDVTRASGTTGLFARIYAFRNVHQTIGSAIEDLTWDNQGSSSNIVNDVGVTTSATKGLAVNLVNIGEDGVTCTDFVGETGGDWTESVAQFSSYEDDDATLQIQCATMSSAGTVDGGSYSIGALPDPISVLGFGLVAGEIPNEVPVNEATPECSNIDDGDTLYAEYKEYQIETYCSDADGYADIYYQDLYLYADDRGTSYWQIRYNQTADAFTEIVDGSDMISIGGSSTKSGSGNDLNITYYITIHWNHIDLTDADFRIITVDAELEDDDDYYEAGFTYETRLDISGLALNDGVGTVDRGNYDSLDTITASGTVIYYDSSLHPLSAEVDIWISCTDIDGSPWYDLILVSGFFQVTVDSDDIVGKDTYNFKVVVESAGASGSDLCHESHSDTYIADRIYVLEYSTDDARIDIETYSSCHVRLKYSYDSTNVTDGGYKVSGIYDLTCYYDTNDIWDFGQIRYAQEGITYDTVSCWSDNTHGITKVHQGEDPLLQIWDEMELYITANFEWTIIGCNVTLYNISIQYQYDLSYSTDFTVVWSNQYPSESIVGSYVYDESVITSMLDVDYGLTAFFLYQDITIVFDNVVIPVEPSKYWVQYSPDAVWLIWGAPSSFEFDYDDSPVTNGIIIQSQMNGTDNARSSTYGGSIFGLSIGPFDTTWYYANISIYAQFTAGGSTHNLLLWNQILWVDILHSLQIVSWSIVPTDETFLFTFQTNRLNASICIWDDGIDSGTLFSNNIYYSLFEGMHEIARSSIIGAHNVTICITSTGIEYDRDYTIGDYVWWYNFTYVVNPSSYSAKIVIINTLYEFIQFETFEVYVNNTRIYQEYYTLIEGNIYNITVKSRFGDVINSTLFNPGLELVVVCNIKILKFISEFESFCEVSISRSGINYTEIVVPSEIIEFKLYATSYYYMIDYLNGETSGWTLINLENSTAIIINGTTTAEMIFAFRTTSNQEVDFYSLNVTISYGANNIILADRVILVPIAETFNISICNLWGVEIYSETFNYTSHKWIELQVYEFVIDNHSTHMVRVDVEYIGSSSNITIMCPVGSRILLLEASIYTVYFTYYANNTGPNRGINYYDQTPYYVYYVVNVTGPGGLEYTGLGLIDIRNNILDVGEGVDENYDQILNVGNNLPGTPIIVEDDADLVSEIFKLALVILGFCVLGVVGSIILGGIVRAIRNDKSNKVTDDNQDVTDDPAHYIE